MYKKTQHQNRLWLRHSAVIFLLLLSLYSLSRSIHRSGRVRQGDSYLLPAPVALGDDGVANLSFFDNRGNVNLPKSQGVLKRACALAGKIIEK